MRLERAVGVRRLRTGAMAKSVSCLRLILLSPFAYDQHVRRFASRSRVRGTLSGADVTSACPETRDPGNPSGCGMLRHGFLHTHRKYVDRITFRAPAYRRARMVQRAAATTSGPTRCYTRASFVLRRCFFPRLATGRPGGSFARAAAGPFRTALSHSELMGQDTGSCGRRLSARRQARNIVVLAQLSNPSKHTGPRLAHYPLSTCHLEVLPRFPSAPFLLAPGQPKQSVSLLAP